MQGVIRLFDEKDYAAITEVHNAAYPDWAESEEDRRHGDATRGPRVVWRRFVYESGGEVLGYASFAQSAWIYHPHKFYLGVVVRPEARRRGIGTALYEHLVAELAPHEAYVLRGEVNEAHADGVRFAEQRGYAVDRKEQESALDLARFEPARFADDVARVEAAGIRLLPYPELAEDPECIHKLYELDNTVSPDMPLSDPLTPLDFELYCRQLFESRRFFGDGFMVAVADGEHYVGTSNLWHCETPGTLHTGLTGVRREFRGRGVATALKAAVLSRVKQLGYERVLTWNDAENANMLGINWRLGFEKRPVWLSMEKILDAAALAEFDAAAKKKEASA